MQFHRILAACLLLHGGPLDAENLVAKQVPDFAIDGKGSAPAWQSTDSIVLTKRNPVGPDHTTRCKVLSSATGLYFLFECEDSRITSTIEEDFGELFHEDVVEVFLWPDPNHTIYFEYELSPKNHELVLLVPNFDGDFHGWRPWRYTGDRRTRHETSIQTATDTPDRTSWTAEFFIPFALLKPLLNVPPAPQSPWRINLYRADFDTGERAVWSWVPFRERFHDYANFGTLHFE